MDYTEEDLKKWVKENKKIIISAICGDCQAVETKQAIFMAGSPGAGKTETAKRIIMGADFSLVHIDQDKIKTLLPGYAGANAEIYHNPASLGVEKVFDYVLKHHISFIFDSTLSKFEKAKENIRRVLRKGYKIDILFVHQNPINAWSFVQKREVQEGRRVPKKAFAEKYMGAREAVNAIKKEFGNEVDLHFVLKIVDQKKEIEDEHYIFDIQNVDVYMDKVYTSEKEIEEIL